MLYQEINWNDIKVHDEWPKKLRPEDIPHREEITDLRLLERYGSKGQIEHYKKRNLCYYNSKGVWSKDCSLCGKNIPRESKYWRKCSSADEMSAECKLCRREKNKQNAKKKLQNPKERKKAYSAVKKSNEKWHSKTSEKDVVNELNLQLKGKTEVTNRFGRIDILTEDTIYEFKKYIFWKAALGQVMAYKLDYPDHNLCIVLFGKDIPKNAAHVILACSEYDVDCKYLLYD